MHFSFCFLGGKGHPHLQRLAQAWLLVYIVASVKPLLASASASWEGGLGRLRAARQRKAELAELLESSAREMQER